MNNVHWLKKKNDRYEFSAINLQTSTDKHTWSFDHHIVSSSVIDKGSFRIRKPLEAWHTSATKHADNNSKPIPNQ